ncbi:hypothetical protein ACN28S_48945 [Cystobacter fuscus]
MLKKILIAFASLLGLLLVIGLLLPTTYRVERSLLILAPRGGVRPGGPTAALGGMDSLERGALPRWAVDVRRAGAGHGLGADLGGRAPGPWHALLSEADPKTGVTYQASLDGGRFSARGRISLASVEGGTQVTWVDEGSLGRSPLRRYLSPFIRSRLGAGIEQGLARLKQGVESSKDAAPSGETPAAAGPTPSAPPDASPVSAAPPVLPSAEPTVSAPTSDPTATASPGARRLRSPRTRP